MNTKIEKKQTPKGQSYWNETGAYNKEYDILYKQLVPAVGEADTVNGELLRASSRLYYEYFNNGNMNACDVKYSDWDEDEEDGEYTIEAYYKNMLDFIRDTIKTSEASELCDSIESIIVDKHGFETEDDEHTYDLLADCVIYYVLTHDNKNRS